MSKRPTGLSRFTQWRCQRTRLLCPRSGSWAGEGGRDRRCPSLLHGQLPPTALRPPASLSQRRSVSRFPGTSGNCKFTLLPLDGRQHDAHFPSKVFTASHKGSPSVSKHLFPIIKSVNLKLISDFKPNLLHVCEYPESACCNALPFRDS